MIRTSSWLVNKGIDDINSANYNPIRTEFMDILADEESKLTRNTGSNFPRLADTMGEAWSRGLFWYTLALSSPTGLFTIFTEQIKLLFRRNDNDEFLLIMPFLWSKDITAITGRKLADKLAYDEQLKDAFHDDPEPDPTEPSPAT